MTIDASANRHAINANIYGVAYGDATTLPDLNCPINRYGGNNSSRYNWQLNADNRGQDWYFESIGDGSAAAGERGDTFFSMSRAGGAQAMLTVPMIGWVGKLGANRNKLSSFSIAKYGAQTGNDWQWFPDAGNGILASNGQNVTGNDPNEANVPADSAFQQGWVQHLVTAWGKAGNGGVGYYILDNEHSIWFATHRDVHPIGPTMDEIKNKIVDYSARIKAVDPTAQVVGPEEWGWSGYFYSGYDQQWGSQHNWSSFPDRANHGGQDYMPWLLAQLKQSSISTGQRPLDVFSLHYYPQGGEFGNDTSTAMQLRRNRSTRSLWDPNYVDETWINDKVELIPRLKNWVNTYYFAGTPVAITEYNWGAESHINGATTQADILGIFGREGLDLAARWTTPDPSTPTYKAIKMYRNYDGKKSGFGDNSVSAGVANPDNLSAFAAVRSSDGALTAIVISKVLSGSTPVTLALNSFSGNGTAQVYQLTAANSIQHLSDIAYSGTSAGLTVPAQSITLFILPKGGASPPPLLSIAKVHSGSFTQGQQNATYTATVSNAANAGSTSGTVTVTENVPSGLTLLSMAGAGWTCPANGNTCTRIDALGPGVSYPPITVTVNVAANASSPQVNQVSASGGGSVTASATDATTILPAAAALQPTWISGIGDDANPCDRSAPCKTFAGAIVKTAAGGEIDCLDSGEFGTLTITKAITINCGGGDGGFSGSVQVSGTNGFVIQTPSDATVTLRNINFQGTGGSGVNAIRFLSGGYLHIQGVHIAGFSQNGIDVNNPAFAIMTVRKSVISDIGQAGVNIVYPAFGAASLDNVQVSNAATGLHAGSNAKIMLIRSIIMGTQAGASIGVNADTSGATVSIDSSLIAFCSTGVSASGGGNAFLGNSSINNNGTGVSGNVSSFGPHTNGFSNNTSNGVFGAGAVNLK